MGANFILQLLNILLNFVIIVIFRGLVSSIGTSTGTSSDSAIARLLLRRRRLEIRLLCMLSIGRIIVGRGVGYRVDLLVLQTRRRT
jgi:hypothetical protein